MSSVAEQPSTRVVIQQVLSARLQTNYGSDDEKQFVEVERGIVVFVCFLKQATSALLPKLAKSILDVKLSFSEEANKLVSILDLPGDVMIVPQATLGGKLKGKVMQYHANGNKTEGSRLYEELLRELQLLISESERQRENEIKTIFCYGTYGNRQVLRMDTNGPFTHLIEL